MFSDNNKISTRQYRRMLVLTTLGMASLTLPRLLVEESETLGIYSLILGAFLLVLFLWGQEVLRNSAFGRALNSPSLLRSLAEKAGLIIYLVILLLAGGFLLQLESSFVREVMLPEVPIWVIMVLFLFVCAYGCIGGGEDQMRTGEYLYYIILVPFLLLFLLTVRELPASVALPNILQPEEFDLMTLLRGAVGALSFFLPFFFFLHRRQELAYKKTGLRASCRALLICFILLGILYVFTVGIFGRAGVKNQTWPITYLMDRITFPGGFLGKGAVLLSSFWILSVFLVLVEILHFLREKTIRITGCSHPRILLVGLLALIFVISLIMGTPEKAEKIYRSFMSHAGLWLLLFASLFVTGCGTPPESRDFVLAISIDEATAADKAAAADEKTSADETAATGDDSVNYRVTFGLPDLSKVAGQEGGQETETSIILSGPTIAETMDAYFNWSGKEVDYTHLKAIVIQENLLSSPDLIEELFSLIESGNLAEDAVLFLSEGDASEILETAATEGGAAGLYLENFYQNNPLMQKYGEVTIGEYYYDCLKEKNGEMVRAKTPDLLVPVLVVTKERPTISRMEKLEL